MLSQSGRLQLQPEHNNCVHFTGVEALETAYIGVEDVVESGAIDYLVGRRAVARAAATLAHSAVRGSVGARGRGASNSFSSSCCWRLRRARSGSGRGGGGGGDGRICLWREQCDAKLLEHSRERLVELVNACEHSLNVRARATASTRAAGARRGSAAYTSAERRSRER